jgi:hypothetical protein
MNLFAKHLESKLCQWPTGSTITYIQRSAHNPFALKSLFSQSTDQTTVVACAISFVIKTLCVQRTRSFWPLMAFDIK